VHVALLRGINVGGKNKLPMAALERLFRDEGCDEVQTYIQSGNVVFAAEVQRAKLVPARVSARLRRDFGLTVPLVARSARDFLRVAEQNPFLSAGVAPEELHVAFLAESPTKPAAAALDPARSKGDRFELRGRELYLHLPNGVARTRLTNAYLDATLGTTSTLRNWRTVVELCRRAAALSG
jgi:uncharacterized protein (DUF1697 family)